MNRDEFFDDHERYLKMATKLKPNDPSVLVRNENAELDVCNFLVFNTMFPIL